MKKAIRLAQEADTAEILKIYEPYITKTAVTFECETPSLDEFRKRIREISANYPYIVCSTTDGKIAGYAYANRHREREAYQWNAELSVYIDEVYHRRGIGKALYGALLEVLRLQNIKNVYGGVTSPNPDSERLHKGLGFKKLGVYPSAGYKCGAWHDVMWFEKSIGEYECNPMPFISITEINKRLLEEIFV